MFSRWLDTLKGTRPPPAATKVVKGSRRAFLLLLFVLGAASTLVGIPTLQHSIRTVVPGIRCWFPVPMEAGRFNVVMAPFVTQNGGNTRVTRDSRDLANFLYSRFENNFAELDLDLPYALRGPNTACPINGRDHTARALAAQQLARKLHASVVIYGVIDLSGDAPAFAPEFYVDDTGIGDVAELTGPYDLGRPVRVDLPLQTGDLVSLAEHPLHARIKALSLIALGLAAYSVDDYDQAIAYYEQAEQIKNWSESAGKDVVYLLLGNTHAMRAARDKSIEDIDAADAYLDRALELAPDSVRALVSKAGVTYQLALGDPAQLRASDVDPGLLDEAEQLYLQALAMPAPEEANIPARVHYSLGQIDLIRHYLLGEDWLQKAKAEFQLVVDAYAAGDTRSPITVGHSYARLGLIAHQLEQNPQDAVDDYTHAIELVTPHWQTRYLLELGDVYTSLHDQEEAQAKYNEALGIAELYGDDELVQIAEKKLQ